MRVSLLFLIFSFLIFSMFAWRTETTDHALNNAAIKVTAFVKIMPLTDEELKNYPIRTITYEKEITITTKLPEQAPALKIRRETHSTCSELADERRFNKFFDIQ